MGAWQEGRGAQDTGGSSGLASGTAGYMRLRKESLVCRFTWQGGAAAAAAAPQGNKNEFKTFFFFLSGG